MIRHYADWGLVSRWHLLRAANVYTAGTVTSASHIRSRYGDLDVMVLAADWYNRIHPSVWLKPQAFAGKGHGNYDRIQCLSRRSYPLCC